MSSGLTARMTHADTDHRPVTVLGAGALGTTLARTFLAGGNPVTVWNRTPGRVSALVDLGATPAASVAEAVAATDVVVASVATYDDLDAVLAPVALSGGLTGRTLVNLVSGTPEQARATATWAAGQGAAYLDGAAMSGTRLIGTPEALFLYGGPAEAFAATEATLATLGRAVHLGADPGLTGVYDTALLGVIMGALAGFYHAAALVGASGADVRDFAPVAARHLESFVAGLVADHGGQIA
ncbi:MAG TPA: NAD(P)-binding domain-containing protein, partial [Egicoccus sp.]